MLTAEKLIENKRLLTSIISNTQNLLKTNKIPTDKVKVFQMVAIEFSRIDFNAVTERNWRVVFEATKLYATTAIKDDVYKLFKIITDLQNAS